MRRPLPLLLTLVLAAAGAAGCDNGPDATTPTDPVQVTRTFNGSVSLNGASVHDFATAGGGLVTATLSTVDPAAATLGLSLGTWNGTACTAVTDNPTAIASSTLQGTTSAVASLCVRLYDPNSLLTSGPVAYTITVVHF